MDVVELFDSRRSSCIKLEIAQVDPPWELILWRGRHFLLDKAAGIYVECTVYYANAQGVHLG